MGTVRIGRPGVGRSISQAKISEWTIEGLGIFSGFVPSKAETRIALLGFVLTVSPRGGRSIEECQL
jgi:hypothetical protein